MPHRIDRNSIEPLVLLLLSSAALVLTAELPKASVTVRVSDNETLQRIADAKVRISFTVPDGHGGTRDLQRTGFTNANGEFSASEATLFNISADAEKAGYYRTGLSIDLHPTLGSSYGPTTVAVPLKAVGNPIAMYARKHARIELPVANKPVGFDLISFDWVPPYGQGQVTDLVFTLSENSSRQLTIAFTNPSDGIQLVEVDSKQGSELRLPRLAPEQGYEATWTREIGNTYAPRQNANYFFRVRTLQDRSKIRSALYGKIHGDIGVDTINSSTALVFLTYYVNPDGSRNVEFDPKKNLFNELPVLEQVREP